MKNKFYLLLFTSCFSLLLYSCSSNGGDKNFQVKGKLTNSNGEFISLINVNSSAGTIIDSVKVDENGEFVFIKKVPEKGFYSLQISPSNYATLITDSTEKVIFEGDATNLNEGYKVSGSTDSEIFLQFNDSTGKKFKQMESLRAQQDSIRRVFETYMNTTTDTVRLDSLSKKLEPVFNSYSEAYRKLAEETGIYIKIFIDTHTASFASLAAVQMLSVDRDITYFIKVADALSAKYPTLETMKGFKEYVEREKHLAYGMPAPEIAMNDKNENPISLSSLKGKVVIVDFWASWCKPCRVENPFVVSLYNKYKDKGLDIFSVSLDFSKDAWLKAIDQDHLVWKNHVSDLKQWQSPVVALYKFNSIPFTCLLDKKGNIAGKNLKGPALEEKIKELLGTIN